MRDFFWQTVRYGLVGASATFVDGFGFFALTRTMPQLREWYLIANIGSFSLAVIWAYVLHRRFTFRAHHDSHRAQLPKFLAVTVIGLGISSAVLHAGIAWVGLYDIVAKLLSVAVTAVWNFAGQKLWTFKRLSVPPGGPYTGPTDSP